MQARTERRLGFVAAIALTTAAFAMPAISTQMAQDMTAPKPQTLHASVDSMKSELHASLLLPTLRPNLFTLNSWTSI